MSPFRPGRRPSDFAALLGLFCWTVYLAGAQEPPKLPPGQADKIDLGKRKQAFVAPGVAGLRTDKNVVEVRLTVGIHIHEIDSDIANESRHRVRTRSYNGRLCGPVIRVRPGDQLRLLLKNEIRLTEWDQEYDPGRPMAPYGFNVTNLHTHGLNVSPLGRADNVFLEVGPEESIDLCFDIPADHPCGTFWYHAHKHGSVALQLAGGMAGVLIVEGGPGSLDDDPSVGAATRGGHERILVFQQIPYRPAPNGGVAQVLPDDVYATPTEKHNRVAADQLKRRTLINGEWFPTISMRPGEVQRWRCVHGGLEETLDMALLKAGPDGRPLDYKDVNNRAPLNEIAVDGLPLGTLETWKVSPVELQPGYRSDLLVKPPGPGSYVLVSLPVPADRSFSGFPQRMIELARVEVRGAPVVPEMSLPKPADLAKYPAQQGLNPVADGEIKATRAIEFRSHEQRKEYYVNEEPFSHEKLLFRPKLGTAEEWTVSSVAGRHPFHVHVNPFQMTRLNERNEPRILWRDTVILNDVVSPEVTIRTRFEKFGGKTVLHCHNLRHEDQGMMAAFHIDGADTVPAKCPAVKAGFHKLPLAAPDWALTDAFGKERKWGEYKGKKTLLVFSRGSGCVHCRAQIQALVNKKAELAAAGLTVIVVAPVAPAKLPKPNGFPYVALSDEEREAFKDYRCHDGRALHGTFLIDSKGQVRWQAAGDEPYMDMDELLKVAGTLG